MSPHVPRAEPDRGSIRVRRATVSDAEMLAALGARLFEETFGAESRPDDLALHLERTFSPDLQRRELADESHVCFVAELGDEAIGYVLLRPSAPPPCVSPSGVMELGRLYVDRRWHGWGVADALVRHLLAEAEARGTRIVWLGVWPWNRRAVRFYERVGFRAVGTHTFWFGTDPQVDQVMVLAFDEAADAHRRGS